MYNFLTRHLILHEQPTFILDKYTTGESLKLLQIVYMKNERMYRAISYYTDASVSATPIGLLSQSCKNLYELSIQDLFTITEITERSFYKLRSEADLLATRTLASLMEISTKVVCYMLDKHSSKLHITLKFDKLYINPVLSIMVVVIDSTTDEILGRILLQHSRCQLIASHSERMLEIFHEIEGRFYDGWIKRLE